MTKTFLRSILAASLVGLIATDAYAFRVIGAEPGGGTTCAGDKLPCNTDQLVARWFNNPVPFWVNQDAASDASDPALSQMDVVNTARDGYQSWEDVPSSIIKFAWVSETSARLGADGINTTLFYNAALDSGSCAAAMGSAGNTLAITILTEVAGTGEIIDADVLFDSADTWALSNACVNFDILSVATHEYGHSIGIHHSDLPAGTMATRPTMISGYFCDSGLASKRSLEDDDRAAAACLYPDTPTVVLVDQTGSMSAGSRMPDAQESANAFISDLADSTMAVSAFASDACGRDGYDQLMDWTTTVADLQGAVLSTSPCGNTPLWESACCALGKAVERAPSSVLIITDTEENTSDGSCSADCPAGFCGCTDTVATAEMFDDQEVALYVIDVTDYHGTGALSEGLAGAASNPDEPGALPVPGRADRCSQKAANADGEELRALAKRTRGLYCSATDDAQLATARIAIERHMNKLNRARQAKITKL